jgi:hypothetical protein
VKVNMKELFYKQKKQENGGSQFLLYAPAAMDVRLRGGERSRHVVYAVVISPPATDKSVALTVTLDYGSRSFLFKDADEISVDGARRKVSFTAGKNKYTIRRLTEADADWAVPRLDKMKKPMALRELEKILIDRQITWEPA